MFYCHGSVASKQGQHVEMLGEQSSLGQINTSNESGFDSVWLFSICVVILKAAYLNRVGGDE